LERWGFPFGERNGGNYDDFFFTVLSKIVISHILMLSKKTSSTTITASTIYAYTGVTSILKEKIKRREKRKRKMTRYFMNRVCGVYGTISICKIALHLQF